MTDITSKMLDEDLEDCLKDDLPEIEVSLKTIFKRGWRHGYNRGMDRMDKLWREKWAPEREPTHLEMPHDDHDAIYEKIRGT